MPPLVPDDQAGGAPPEPMKVVIVGAGPSGLLLAHYLLEKGNGRFRVSIHEAREDPRVTMKRPPTPRRYSLGLSQRGKAALDKVDGLWAAVKAAGVPTKLGKIWLFGRLIELPGRADPTKDDGNVITDRTALCAAMLEHLMAKYGDTKLLEVRFNQSCTQVDMDARTVTFSDVQTGGLLPIDRINAATGIETAGVKGFVTAGVNGHGEVVYTKEYDLLVGADGVRSVVRGSMMQHLRSFDYEQRDLGSQWLVANIPVPPATEHNWMIILGSKPGGLGGLLLPSTLSLEGDPTMCLVLGWQIAEPPEPWLALKTGQEAKEFLERHLPWLQVPLEAAESLVTQRPSRSMQLKCSQYHDADGRAVLMGDAAHSTSPSIGQGCNTSLADAAALASLLLGMSDASELPGVLERYSALRVPEGHALVDLSESQAPMKVSLALGNAIRMFRQGICHWLLPKVFIKPVMTAAGTTQPLAEIYRLHKKDVDRVLDSNRQELKKLREKEFRTKQAVFANADNTAGVDPTAKKVA